MYALEMVEKVAAEALSMLGLHRALVVHGLDGPDEIYSSQGLTDASRKLAMVTCVTYEVDPEEFGHAARATLADISGGDAAEKMQASSAKS